MMTYRKPEGMHLRFIETVEASGLTTKEICERTGIAHSTFYSHLRGAQMYDWAIAKYCTLFHISADWLLGLKR